MSRARPTRPPLDRGRLDDLALRYVARFATSRKRLADYLRRKVAERGWDGDSEAPVDAIVERMSELNYIDDAAFALGRARSLTARGYGERRLAGDLAAAGIDEDDRRPALDSARADKARSALAFARRKRIGPYAVAEADRALREKWLGALVRAGHDFALARRIANAAPGEAIEADD